MNDNNLMTIPEMAEYLKVSRGRAYEIIEIESIPIIKLSDRGTRVRKEDIQKYIESKLVSPNNYL